MRLENARAWTPVFNQHPAMMGNLHPAFRAQMGIAPVIAVAAKWGLPWLLTAAGIAATAFAAKSVFREIPINKEKIGLAAFLGGGGVTSYLIADVVPEGWRAIPYALAVGGVASSLYFLFSKSVDKEVPIYPNDVYAGISAIFVRPPRSGEIAMDFLTDDYEVFINWRSQSKVDFIFRFLVREQLSGFFGMGQKITKAIYPEDAQMELSAGAFKPKNYKIPIIGSQVGWVSAIVELGVEAYNPNTGAWQSVGSNFFNVTRL